MTIPSLLPIAHRTTRFQQKARELEKRKALHVAKQVKYLEKKLSLVQKSLSATLEVHCDLDGSVHLNCCGCVVSLSELRRHSPTPKLS
jgi:hypothetical protein